MLEAVVAGVIAHGIYHYSFEIEHSEDNTHHVSKNIEQTWVNENPDVAWVFEKAQVQ